MKKIDFHVHTINTEYDDGFSFSLDALVSYVNQNRIDGIAITNHNCFNKEQYLEIVEALTSSVVVFPGIEIHIGKPAGHMLVVSDPDRVNDFASRCAQIERQFNGESKGIGVDDFIEIFPEKNHIIAIPHYAKNPAVSKEVIQALRDYIPCGEVSSVKKFIYCKKDDKSLTPVYFSDLRMAQGSDLLVPRQTYIDIEKINISTLRTALRDKHKVWLANDKGHEMFQALHNLKLSTGLNVIIGGRSSGKTYTLDKIFAQHENVKYIRQFSLLETEQERATQRFEERIQSKESDIANDYLAPFSSVVKEIKAIDLKADEQEVEQYVHSLLLHAQETDRQDIFSKCNLYNEALFSNPDLKNLELLIDSVETLLSSHEYKTIISRHISFEALIGLLEDLIKQYRGNKELILKRTFVNDIVSTIKRDLRTKTADTPIAEIDLHRIHMNRVKVRKFNTIAEQIKRPGYIFEKAVGDFQIRVSKKAFHGAQEMRTQSHSQVAFSEAYAKYSNPYEFLMALKDTALLSESDYYRYFTKIEYELLNSYGLNVSGGERSEFNLLQEIEDANTHDMLLIDEPESSFDNVFLRDQVNELLKDISQNIPVVIVTHNNTVGMSIRPNYIVHTKRTIKDNGEIAFEIYGGFPGEKRLYSESGNAERSHNVALDCFEAGEDTYRERSEDYEMLKD